MEALLNQFVSNKVCFESYTKFTEDYKSIDKYLQDDYVSEIKTLKDVRGKETIFAMTRKGIICFYMKENAHNYSTSFINMPGHHMCVCLRNGKFEIYAMYNEVIYKSIEVRDKVFSPKEVYNIPNLDKHYFLSVNSNDMRQSLSHCLVFMGYDYSKNKWGYYFDMKRKNENPRKGFYELPVQSVNAPATVLSEVNNEYPLLISYEKESRKDALFFQLLPVGGDYGLRECYFNIDVSCNVRFIPFNGTEIFLSYYKNNKTYICSLNKPGTGNEYYLSAVTELEGKFYEIKALKKKNPADNQIYYHFFARNIQQELHHIELRAMNKQFILFNSCPIEKDLRCFDFVENGEDIVLYISKLNESKEPVIQRLEYDEYERQWSEYDFTASTKTLTTTIPCYSTEFKFTDTSLGLPAKDLNISIYASDNVLLDTPKGFVEIGRNRKAAFTTDSNGCIFFTQYCNNVDAIPIMVEIPSVLGENSVLQVRQHERIQQKLEKTTANDFYTAKKKGDKSPEEDGFLIPPEFRSIDNAKSLYDGVQQTLKHLPAINDNPVNFGVYLGNQDTVYDFNRINTLDDTHWSLTVVENKLIYKKLTRQQAEARIASLRSENDSGFFDFLKSIGDFFMAVAKKIVSVVETIVSGVKKAFYFVVNGLKYLVEFIIETLRDVFDCIAVIFAQITIFFIDLFLWLAFRVRWSDVLRTKDAVKQVTVNALNRFPEYIEGLESQFISALEGFKDSIVNELEKAKVNPQINGKKIGDYSTYKDNPDLNYALSNNMMMRNYTELSEAPLQTIQLSVNVDDLSLDEIVKELKSFIATMERSPGVQKFSKLIDDFGRNPAVMYDSPLNFLIDLLEAFIEMLFDGVKEVSLLIFKLINSLVRTIIDMLNEPLNIPFFSAFYKELTKGGTLTCTDLSSLLIGFTATIVYSITNEGPIFKGDAEVTQFVKATDFVFAKAGSDGNVPGHWDRADYKIGLFASISGTICTASGLITDGLSIQDKHKKTTVLFDGVSLLSEISWLVLGHPGFYGEWHDEKMERLGWYYFLGGTVMDTVFFFATKKYTSLDDLQKACTTFYGFGHVAVTIIRCCNSDMHAGSVITEMLCSLKEILSPLTISKDPKQLAIYFIVGGVTAAGILGCFFWEEHEGGKPGYLVQV